MSSVSGGSFQPRVAVAIDFGTHGSGWAWAPVSSLMDRPENRTIVYNDYTTSPNVRYPKDLTAVLVDQDREAIEFGHKARRTWLREIKRGNPRRLGYAIQFKMALRADAPESEVARFYGSLTAAGHADVLALVADMLRHLRSDALENIRATGHLGVSYTEDDIRWCITVPAIWRDPEKDLMRKAALSAGFPADEERLLLVSEPEAASVYCALAAGTELGPTRAAGHLNVGVTDSRRFLVVDCGGGTVDITGYQIRPEGVGDNRLKEIGIADGGAYGSAYINNAFVQQVLADRFGPRLLKELLDRLPDEMAALEDLWESEKVDLVSATHSGGTPYFVESAYIQVPGRIWESLDEETKDRLTDQAAGEDYMIVVSKDEITALFETVVPQTLAAIERERGEMLDDGPEAGAEQVLIVGGFARSAYLRDRIAQRFGDEVRVLVGRDPAVAVLAGAVHFAYDPSIIWGRRSKYTYGYGCSMAFREGIDPGTKRYVDPDGEVRCDKRFGVMARRGQFIPVDDTEKRRVRIPRKETRGTWEVGLYATYAGDPEYIDEEGCQRLGTVVADISGQVGTERWVEVHFAFGRSQIEAEILNPFNGARKPAKIEFEDIYGRGR
jgi:molecular chaperone DnaK (HSP70)